MVAIVASGVLIVVAVLILVVAIFIFIVMATPAKPGPRMTIVIAGKGRRRGSKQ
jgi:hypothetical protein